MNKRITRKIMAATLVATLFVGGAFAQILTNYVIQSAPGQSVDSVTTASTTRLYVYPDVVYSPGYVAAANAPLGANARWTWYDDLLGVGAVVKAAANENWYENTWPAAAGTVPLSVRESNTGFACPGAPVGINVEVIDPATVAYTVANATPVFGSAGSPYIFCSTEPRLLTDRVQAAFTEDIAGNSISLQLQYSLAVAYTTDNGGTWTPVPALAQSFLGSAGTQITAINTATYNMVVPGGGGYVPYTVATVQYPTRFTYTLLGVNDKISRKSDYLTNSAAVATAWSWYDTVAQEALVITVNPVPVTGPIYHISNMWAN